MSAVADTELRSPAATPATLNLVDDDNPWLGLDSFTEETRQFFHGREEEVAELARRVQRKTLAILFGQSGLGKTSILRAGIVPRLRREGYCPVYVRIDYAKEAPAPSQQIKQAIFRATEGAGKWTRPGTAVPGESLWEFLHHRDDVLVDSSGRPLTPLLIFDQFEEIFTLAQDDDFGRQRAAEFVEDLADLVENRAPRALEMMLEDEESVVERFDFNRADYRILIALREDYLAHLEGLKAKMPSITQNRMRLARMTGQQALAAVVKPGGRLVSQEVAESIVRFIAGGSELRNAEVEPSLLSLVCRELNNARAAQGRAEISADLLAGSRDTILNEFYERALQDQPAGVRRFIEDEMLTESGFRESLAEERVLRAFAAAGVAPGALAALVNRRLLRIEERLDMRRVELTHDVLCDVVIESRDQRHEREAREEAERQLEAQREREAATHRALVRARKIAAGCAVLAIVAIGGAFFGYMGMKQAQEARGMAEGARAESEKLILYLLDDFYLELEPVGRVDVAADLAKRAVDYYAALPAALRTPETERNHALALARYGYVLRNSAKQDEALAILSQSIATLRELRRKGDASESSAAGLALALGAQARVRALQRQWVAALEPGREAAALLADAAARPSASVQVLRVHATVTNILGWALLRNDEEEEALKVLGASREAFRRIDGLRLKDLSSAAGFAEASSWQAEALFALGRIDDAKRVATEASQVAESVLQRAPHHMQALRSDGLASGMLAGVEQERFHRRAAEPILQRYARAYEELAKLDPGNTVAWNNLSLVRTDLANVSLSQGRLAEGMARLRSALDIEGQTDITSFADAFMGPAVLLAFTEADLGLRSEAANPRYRRIGEMVRKTSLREAQRAFISAWVSTADVGVAYFGGDYRRVRELAPGAVRALEALKPTSGLGQRLRPVFVALVHQSAGLASLKEGDHAESEVHFRRALESQRQVKIRALSDKAALSEHAILLAIALGRQGKRAEALALVEPELKFQQELVRQGSDDLYQHLVLAQAHLAAAVASPPAARSHLAEAAAIVDRFPAEMKRRRTVAQMRAWIAEEIARRG